MRPGDDSGCAGPSTSGADGSAHLPFDGSEGTDPDGIPKNSDEDDARRRSKLAGDVDVVVKDLLRCAMGVTIVSQDVRPDITDVLTDGGVTRLVETVRLALEHGARTPSGWLESFLRNENENNNSTSRTTQQALEQFEKRFVSTERSLMRYMALAATDAGKIQNWIKAGLHKRDLHERVAAFVDCKQLISGESNALRSGFYHPNAWAADEESTVRVVGTLRGLAVLPFSAPGGAYGINLDAKQDANETDEKTREEPKRASHFVAGVRALETSVTGVAEGVVAGIEVGVSLGARSIAGIQGLGVSGMDGLKHGVDGLKSGVGVVTDNVQVGARSVVDAGKFTAQTIGGAFRRSENVDDDLLRDMRSVLQQEEAIEHKQ